LNNWRSDIGKAGHRAITNMWDADPSTFSSADDRAEHIAANLKDFRYLYKYPDATVSPGPSVWGHYSLSILL